MKPDSVKKLWPNKILQPIFGNRIAFLGDMDFSNKEEKAIQKMCDTYKIKDVDNINIIYLLIRRAHDRPKREYEVWRDHIDEVSTIDIYLQQMQLLRPFLPNQNEQFPLNSVELKFSNGKKIRFKNPILLTNLYNHALPHLKNFAVAFKNDYLDDFTEVGYEKKKQGAKQGKNKAQSELENKLFRYIKSYQSHLTNKEVGDFIYDLFSLAGFNVIYKGKNRGKDVHDKIEKRVAKK